MSGHFYFLLLPKVMTILVKRMHVFSTLKLRVRKPSNCKVVPKNDGCLGYTDTLTQYAIVSTSIQP